MKAICTCEIPAFTKGKEYAVTHIDNDGDIWVEADDDGFRMFFYPDECEVITE